MSVEDPSTLRRDRSEQSTFRSAGIVVLAVLWPLGTILFELFTRMSAESYVDPLPTIWHLLLLALVPAAGVAGVIHGTGEWSERRARITAILVGAGIGVSAVYSLVFLPILPMAVFAVMMGGLGLLPMAPLAALFGLLSACGGLTRRARVHGVRVGRRVAAGAGLAVLTLAAFELPGVVLREGVRRASSTDPEVARSGVRMLRSLASEDSLALALRFRGPRSRLSMLPPAARQRSVRLNDAERRKLYFRVTGRDLLADASGSSTSSWTETLFGIAPSGGGLGLLDDGDAWVDTARWDSLQGTDVVGGVLPEFHLAACTVDAVVDADAAVAYVEWVMRLRNDDRDRQREGRAEIALPPGSAVSRLSLWVEGKERDAAFAGRARTTGAYEDVAVVRREDPALVTTKGADRVLLRCFPVPRRGEMKLRIGVTVPLEFGADPAAPARFALPHLVARNFALTDDCTVWITSNGELFAPDADWSAGRGTDGEWTLRGAVGADRVVELMCAQRASEGPAWCSDPIETDRFVVQTIEERTAPPPASVVVVVDGGTNLRRERERIESVVRAIDASLEPRFVLASEDEAPRVMDRDEALDALDDHAFRGGVDNQPALEVAWDAAFASGRGDALVLWLHGPQPVDLGASDALLQRYRREGGGPEVLGVALVGGTNRLEEALLEAAPRKYRARSAAGLEDDVARLHDPRSTWRRRFSVADAPAASGREVTDHVARLRVLDLVRDGAPEDEEALRDLAATYRLVTPLTGAVVLERASQYERHGLDPSAPPRAVPTVPEPGEWALIAVGAAALVWIARRRRPALGAAA